MTVTLAAFLIALLMSLGLTPAARAWARQRGWVAQPRADRWHRGPVALMGGIAICGATEVAAWVVGVPDTRIRVLLGLGVVMFAVGMWDDLAPLRAGAKLLAQLVVALALVFLVRAPGVLGLPAVDTMLAVLWVVGITNAINLLDNMDGLAAGIAIIAAVFLFVLGLHTAAPAALMLTGALTGSLLGFLVFNFHPASVFMGDSGSLFVGFLLAALPLAGTVGPQASFGAALLAPAILLAVPIVDTTLVVAARFLAGRPVVEGGRDHASHRLVIMGFSERRAVVLLYGLAASAGGIAVLVQRGSPGASVIAVTLFSAALIILAVHLARVGVYGDADFNRLAGWLSKPLIRDLTYRRRLFEVLLDFVLVWAAYAAAFRLRFDGEQFAQFYPPFIRAMPIVMLSQMVGLWLGGVYGGVWRFLSIVDVLSYVRGVVLGTSFAVLAVVYVSRFEGYSRGVFVIDAVLLLFLLIGSRFSLRLLHESAGKQRASGVRALVYGSTAGSGVLLRELISNPALEVRPVGLIDDEPAMEGQRILGIRVLGTIEKLDEWIARTGAEQVIVCTDSASSEKIERVRTVCRDRGVKVRQMRLVIE